MAHRQQHEEFISFLYALFEDFDIEKEFINSAVSFDDFSKIKLDKIEDDDLVILVAKALKQMLNRCEEQMKKDKKEQMSQRADEILIRRQSTISAIDQRPFSSLSNDLSRDC